SVPLGTSRSLLDARDRVRACKPTHVGRHSMALRTRLAVSKLAGSMFDFSTKAHRKEAWLFLDTVWQGLEYLSEQVERAEKERAKSLGLNFGYCDFGSHPDDAMICNYFIWYSNALCNFIGVFKKAFRK